MKATDLAERILSAASRKPDDEVRIVVHSPGSIGPRPSVALASAGYGFDWENGTFELVPSEPLTRLTAEDVAAIRSSVSKGQSWHAYQAHKKFHERIKSLEDELAKLKGAA